MDSCSCNLNTEYLESFKETSSGGESNSSLDLKPEALLRRKQYVKENRPEIMMQKSSVMTLNNLHQISQIQYKIIICRR
ncbi:hypothetical protein RCL_jg3114.t1 [Rhizophagus clarus]|uniref:Uncharacterized protein n=1 Tax=Rhizophagus clarus TaxID=94130 RepID=A0A8H3MC00_9GLOM|nr:hypothetical protein RCL_jg3114.t1 [Rhizophagus clarus]